MRNHEFDIAVEDTGRPESFLIKYGSRKAAKSDLWKDSKGGQ